MISIPMIGAIASAVKSAIQSDPYFSSVTNLLHFTGSNGSTTITDQKTASWSCIGNAKISTSIFDTSPSSANFDGSGDYLLNSVAASNYKFLHDGSSFTIEFSFYATSFTSQRVILCNNAAATASTGFCVDLSSTGVLRFQMTKGSSGTSVFNITGSALSINTMYRVAVVHNTSLSPDCTIYVNGSVYGTGNAGSTYSSSNPTYALTIGATYNNTLPFVGYIDEVRITSGISRYTSAYIPSLPFHDS